MGDPDFDFALPSARHVTDLTVFWDHAKFNKDGSALVVFKLPPEMKPNILALSDNDGMALNVRVWETRLPMGMEELARAVGLEMTYEDDEQTVPVVREK